MWDKNIYLGITCIKVIIKIMGPKITQGKNVEK